MDEIPEMLAVEIIQLVIDAFKNNSLSFDLAKIVTNTDSTIDFPDSEIREELNVKLSYNQENNIVSVSTVYSIFEWSSSYADSCTEIDETGSPIINGLHAFSVDTKTVLLSSIEDIHLLEYLKQYDR